VRVGFDIGGTFTDLVLMDDATGGVRLHKVLTTPEQPEAAALQGLDELLAGAGVSWSEVQVVVHGTTLVTNALIEGKGARVGLLTTAGFRDTLAMGREQRYDPYNLRLRFPPPIVPRRLRAEVAERTLADGTVERAPDPAEVRRVASQLVAAGAEVLAVVFLHSYRNPANERAAAAVLADAYPAVPVVCSCDVAPEIREYERTSTTVACACVRPLVGRYLARLAEALSERGFGGRLLLMQSSGGTAEPAVMAELPVRLLESGPAGGALAAAWLGETCGLGDLLSFDMGGTTAKACLIEHGRPAVVAELEVARADRFRRGSGMPVRTPTIDLIEIGAGGGSIARVDRLGLLKVGPESAGADPGPACYGRGGREPTVTDANLLLGYLGEASFLGGRMRLDSGAARAAVGELASRVGLDLVAAAWGVHQLVNQNMAAAARMHVLERGRDPRRLTLVAFGGAGPAHAAAVAKLLGIRRVIVPYGAGATSALGFLAAPQTLELGVSRPCLLDEAPWQEIEALYDRLEGEATRVIPGPVSFRRLADMRFLGQVHELSVPLADDPAEAFRTAYRQRFGRVPNGFRIQVLTWRLAAEGPRPHLRVAPPHSGAGAGPYATREVFFPATGFVRCAVYRRGDLATGQVVTGPAVVEEDESTTVLGPGDRLEVDGARNLWLTVGAAQPSLMAAGGGH
jgi:5-oxoprolinase (ATP-hydrolysing)